MPDDSFQCNSYLIYYDGKGILVDPGSVLFFDSLIEKITALIPLQDIVGIIAQHQDPDVCGNIVPLNQLLEENGSNVSIYTHYRTALLIKHYGAGLNFVYTDQLPEEKINITESFQLEFIHTPYLHAPGAITTYFPKDKVLLSSDLFGGITKDWTLYAGDNYFEEITSFHRDYMPSKEILLYAMRKLDEYDIDLIAPQHGSIMNRKQAQEIIQEFKDFECGLYISQSFRMELEKAQKVIQEQHEIMRQELLTAASFQKTLLPPVDSTICGDAAGKCSEGIDFSFYLKPCNEVSGDFIIVEKIDKEHFGMMIIDVMGHGVSAGLATIEISLFLMT